MLVYVLKTIEHLLRDNVCASNTIVVTTAPVVDVAALARLHELLDGYIVILMLAETMSVNM